MTRVVALVFAALALVSCGSSAEPTAADLFREYLDATNVKNDPFPGGTAGDRRVAMASRGSVRQVQHRLFAAEQCGDDLDESARACDLGVAVVEAVRLFAGPTGVVHRRSVLVKSDGGLEWVRVYVVRKPDGSSALVDTDGRLHLAGLDDFVEDNELLAAADWVLTPRDVTSTSGVGELVAITGPSRPPWALGLVIGACLVVVAAVGRLVLVRRRRPESG